MGYMGGKFRVGPHIARVVNSLRPTSYHEPCCGMYSVGRHVVAGKRTGADVHPDLVMMLNAVRDGWRGPDIVTEAEFRALKLAEPSALRAFVGFGCGFGGRFFASWARSNWTWDKMPDGTFDWQLNSHNFAAKHNRSLDKLRPQIQGVEFTIQDYLEYEGDADVIYADPPYAGVCGYTAGTFDTNQFWDWIRKQSKHRIIVVSESQAPSDATCVAEFKSSTQVMSNAHKGREFIERLFTYNAPSIFTHQVSRR